jgi:hypothetical protein
MVPVIIVLLVGSPSERALLLLLHGLHRAVPEACVCWWGVQSILKEAISKRGKGIAASDSGVDDECRVQTAKFDVESEQIVWDGDGGE